MTNHQDAVLTPAEAAERLKVSVSFLAKARMTGVGPRYRKVGRAVRYSASDLEAFLRSCGRTSTSEGQPARHSTREPSGSIGN